MERERVVERRRCDGSWERVVVYEDGSVAPGDLWGEVRLQRVVESWVKKGQVIQGQG